MPTTPIFGFPYPALTDAPNVPSHMQQLATGVETTLGKGILLGSATNGTNVVDTSLNYVAAVSCAATIPTGLPTTRRVLVLGTSQVMVGTVGNVDGGISMTDATTGPITTTNWVSFGGFVTTRPPAPVGNASYNFTTWAVGALPAAGAHTWTLRFRNLTAGSWTSYFAGLAVILL